MEERDGLASLWYERVLRRTTNPLGFFPSVERYWAFCVANTNLQDSSDAIYAHRHSGFSADELHGYVEWWGLLQAIVIQQDAIIELHQAVSGGDTLKKRARDNRDWMTARELRILYAGHPNRQGSPVRRAVVPRQVFTWQAVETQIYDDLKGRFETVALNSIIEAYDRVAAGYVSETTASLCEMIDKWEG